MITSNKRNHHTLLTAQNLLTVIRKPQSHVLPIIPRGVSKVVVLGEHHVLKNLLFYEKAHEADEEAHEANAKARQECLDHKDEKRQEGKLKKAPGEKGQRSFSTARPPTKKKKPSMKTVKVLALVLASPFDFTPSIPSSPKSFVPDSGDNLDPLRYDLDPLRSDLNPRSSESEPVMPYIFYKSDAEEEMVVDLRADFKDRQRKWLFKPIEVVAPPAKRSCLEEVHEDPVMDPPPTPVPPFYAIGSSSVPATASSFRTETCSAQDGAPDCPSPTENDIDQKDALSSISSPNWEEMMEILRRMPCFTDAESPSTKLLDFFPFTKQVLVSLGGDPPISVTTWLPLGTIESTVSLFNYYKTAQPKKLQKQYVLDTLLLCLRM